MPSQPQFPPVSPDLLLRHAASIRALARGLLADEHAAEDVLQETWLTALERPPRSQSRLGGWLRTVAQSLAMKRLRGEGRRAERERQSAREESLASTAEVLAQRQTLRRVVDAVLALREPYQSVVLLRYYEDLPPREISSKLGVPVATVQSQLHRGLALLREELDADDLARGEERGHWALALGTLTGWKAGAIEVATGAARTSSTSSVRTATSAGSSGALAGITSMLLHYKFVTGVAALGLLIAALPNSREVLHPEPSRAVSVASEPQQGGAEVQTLAPAQQGGSERRALGPQPSATKAAPIDWSRVPADASYAYVLEGVILRDDDRPLAQADVRLGPVGHPFNVVAETAEDGSFRVAWRGFEPSMELGLSAKFGRAWTGLYRLEVQAGRTNRVRLGTQVEAPVGAAEKSLVEQVRSKQSQLQAVGEISKVVELERRAELALKPRVAQGSLRAQAPLKWDAPAGRFLGDMVPAATPAVVELSVSRISEAKALEALQGKAILVRKLEEQRLVELAAIVTVTSPRSSLSGVVRDELGAPLAGVRLIVRGEQGWFKQVSGPDGSFLIDDLPASSEVTVSVGGQDDGLAERTFVAPAEGRNMEWDPVLERGLELEGRVLSERGMPLEGWLVEFLVGADDPAGGAAWYDSTRVRADGSFAIPNLPDRGGRVLLSAGGWNPIPVVVLNDVRPNDVDLDVVVTAAQQQRGELSLRVQDAAGAETEAEVRLWHAESDRGIWLQRDAESGLFTQRELPAGLYRLEVGAPTQGWVELGDVWIAADEVTDLGPVRLPQLGTLSVTAKFDASHLAAESLSWRLEQLRHDVASELVTQPLGEAFESALTPGSYVVRVTGRSFVTHTFPVEVRAGETSELVLDLGGVGTRLLRFHFTGALDGREGLPFELDSPSGAHVLFGAEAAALAGGDGSVYEARVALSPGTYRVKAGPLGDVREARFDATESGTIAIELD